MEQERARSVRYRCVVGHEIARADLDRLTLVTSLDAGAEVRICRQHGAPIATSSQAIRVDPAGDQT